MGPELIPGRNGAPRFRLPGLRRGLPSQAEQASYGRVWRRPPCQLHFPREFPVESLARPKASPAWGLGAERTLDDKPICAKGRPCPAVSREIGPRRPGPGVLRPSGIRPTPALLVGAPRRGGAYSQSVPTMIGPGVACDFGLPSAPSRAVPQGWTVLARCRPIT